MYGLKQGAHVSDVAEPCDIARRMPALQFATQNAPRVVRIWVAREQEFRVHACCA